MKVISFASFKGGCGKTTALQIISSILIMKNKRVAIFEADINRPIAKWRDIALKQGTWDDACEIFNADEMLTWEQSHSEAEDKNFDYVLVDTHGGGSDLNQSVILNSDFIIVPSAPTQADIQITLETMKYAITALQEENQEANIALLWTRFSTGKLTSAEEIVYQKLETLDQFENKLHKRDPFASIAANGLLHLRYKQISENPKLRLKARHFGQAVNEAEAVTNDLLEIMGDV